MTEPMTHESAQFDWKTPPGSFTAWPLSGKFRLDTAHPSPQALILRLATLAEPEESIH